MLEDPAKIIAIFDELKNKPELKGQDLRVFQGIEFKTEQSKKLVISINIQKPGKLEVLVYKWDGLPNKWSDGKERKLSGDLKNFNSNTFELSRFNANTIPVVIKQYQTQAKAEAGDNYTGVTFSLNEGLVVRTNTLEWTAATIDKTQNAIRGHYDENGNLLNFYSK